jgi:hypothetical protein
MIDSLKKGKLKKKNHRKTDISLNIKHFKTLSKENNLFL